MNFGWTIFDAPQMNWCNLEGIQYSAYLCQTCYKIIRQKDSNKIVEIIVEGSDRWLLRGG